MTGVVPAVLAVTLGLVGAEVAKQIVAREYDSWAPALARALVGLAGRIHPPRAREWRADLAYLQTVEGGTGLWAACSHLTAAPRLTGVALGSWLCDTVTGRGVDAVELAAALSVGRRRFGRDHAEWLRFRADEAGQPYDQAENVYRLAEVLAAEPRIVSFVCSADGAMRGLTVEGAQSEGVCVAASIYARHRERIARGGRHVAVVEDDVLEAVAHIAADTANFFGCQLPDSGCVLTFVFDGGSPDERLMFGKRQAWYEGTTDRATARLARTTLGDRAWSCSSECGLLIRIPSVREP